MIHALALIRTPGLARGIAVAYALVVPGWLAIGLLVWATCR